MAVGRFLTPISKPKYSTRPALSWSISGPNGAAPAAIAPAARRDFRRDGRQGQIVKLNVGESKTASKYGVMSIPTLMIFKGGEMASRQVGAAPKQKLQQDHRCGLIRSTR
jgi:hypothetical protein